MHVDPEAFPSPRAAPPEDYELKYRLAALLIATAAIPIAWHPLQAQPAPPVVPFADGISIAGYSAGSITFFARQASGSYTMLQFATSEPNSLLSPMGAFLQLLSGGSKVLLDAPGGPAGVGRQSQAIAGTDLDNTGTLGVATVSDLVGADNSVTVFQATLSEPSLHMAANYPIGPGVNGVFFADFNGDGFPDLAVSYDGNNTVPGGIAILLNQGDGTFGSPVSYARGTQATQFAVLDLNNDGALDIATESLDQTVTVLLGKGNGTFGTPASYAVGGSGQAIAIADFNGDGVPDIAAGTTLLLGNGNGTFRVGPPLPVGAANIWAFAAGDLDGDGNMDLVYADIQNQLVVPLFGTGAGAFSPGAAYAVSQMPNSLVLADYNKDGLLDIINGTGDARALGYSVNSGNVDILLNNGDGTFQGAAVYSPAQYGFLQASGAGAAVANFGGTFPGVLASSNNGTLTLFQGNGKGGFQTPQNFTIPPAMAGSSGYAGAIAAADFNGDKLPDAAVVTSNGIAILLANAGGFGTPTILSGPFPSALVAADFDGDGKADLVAMSAGDGDQSSPGTLSFLKGKGDGTFQAPVTIPAGFSPTFVSAVDINGDGHLDLIFSDGGYEVSGNAGVGGAIYVALNQGGGTFQAPVPVFSGIYPAFTTADINGDGKLDLIASGGVNGIEGGVVSWLAGNGNGTFQAAIAISNSDVPINSIAVQDFNGDGILDMVLAHQDEDTTFLAGYGNGVFSAETHFEAAYEPTLLLTTDLNGDKKPDLIVLGVTMSVLLNNSAAATTIQTSPAGLQFSVDGGGAQTAPQTLSLATGSHTIAATTPQPGATGTQYVFTGWSDGGAVSHSITVEATAATYTASFKTQYQLTISASPAGDGTVTPASGTFYDAGAIVPVTATAGSGDAFTNWTGSVASSSSNSTTVSMTAPQTLTANFSGGSGHPAFFSGEASLGGGVYYLQFPDSNLFGYYNYPSSSILYHYDLGFEAFIPSTAGQIYFYDFASGHWWYTSSGLFPYLYDFTLNTFIYYFPDPKNAGHYSTNPRYFSNLTTQMIFTM